ncbi:hypothetical protein SAMN02745121_08577 [Nannocystis exedens]|uniref:Uncharacterized protein n=1 Tax=Nannocystis exedens TaxID=54 RepID=A0A1I2ID75_9BACT|nr:hypothetical protein [Nannocystis exedens]PCC68192.1 hypothetical protein NAEX_01202 [Nannocystis exedens]SFF39580.1 hypothetical protein SAMN02745121_08577 [Nannocystis exedens]
MNFPTPEDLEPDTPYFCDRDEILALYNRFCEAKKQKASSVAKTVKGWFYSEAKKCGWDGVHFVTNTKARTKYVGCVMWKMSTAPKPPAPETSSAKTPPKRIIKITIEDTGPGD